MGDFGVDSIVVDLHSKLFEEYKKMQLWCPEITDGLRGKHEDYIKKMTTPMNPANDLLHKHWQPWAERYSYLGVGDVMVMSRENNERLQSRKEDESSGSDEEFETALTMRSTLLGSYGYAIPNEIALNVIVDINPILEIGSGSGYWTHLLREKGADVIAVDNKSEPFKIFHIDDTIFMDGVLYLHEHHGCRDRTLLLCWPRWGHEMVQAFTGDRLVIVGEPEGGATWAFDEDDEEFAEWELIEIVDIPTWPGMKDDLRIYQRQPTKIAEDKTEITSGVEAIHLSSGTSIKSCDGTEQRVE